jgi:quercetin dioxygenase-like cupin family protein
MADKEGALEGAAKAVDLVEYQDGAVVSREILDKKTGGVTLFAFDEGEGLREHTVPYDALVYLLDGEAEITISGVAHQVQAGDVILMPGNQPHALKAPKRFKMMLTMIRT